MKIKISESKLKEIVNESIKNCLNEIDALKAVKYGRDAYSQGSPINPNFNKDNTEYNSRKRAQGNNITKMAVDKMNSQGSGKCITGASPWQLNYVSASGLNVFLQNDGIIGVVGSSGKPFIRGMNPKFKVEPVDAKLIVGWCNEYLKNEAIKQYCLDVKTWSL